MASPPSSSNEIANDMAAQKPSKQPNAISRIVLGLISSKPKTADPVSQYPKDKIAPYVHATFKQGFLLKEGGNYKTWKKRYFELKFDGIHYFKAKNVQRLGLCFYKFRWIFWV